VKVKIHKLFEYLLETAGSTPEAFLGLSQSASPALGDFLEDLDPALSLDWNGRSFFGLPELRERVIEYAELKGACTSDDVLITAGAAEANYLAMRQLLEPGDEIIAETPGWPQAPVMAEAIGARLISIQRREADGWGLNVDELAEAITPKTKLIFLTNPNNPTGKLLHEKDLRRIVEVAGKAGVWILVDEVYAGLEWNGLRQPSIAGMYDRGITTGSVSKALGLQGLRTGWMITRNKALLRDAMILRENSSEIMNILGEVIAEIALRPERIGPAMAKARQDGAANLATLDGWLSATPELDWIAPEAGLIGMARLTNGMTGDQVSERLLADPYRAFVIPGSAYGLPGHIRLGVGGGQAAKLDVGLAQLSAFFRDSLKT